MRHAFMYSHGNPFALFAVILVYFSLTNVPILVIHDVNRRSYIDVIVLLKFVVSLVSVLLV